MSLFQKIRMLEEEVAKVEKELQDLEHTQANLPADIYAGIRNHISKNFHNKKDELHRLYQIRKHQNSRKYNDTGSNWT